MLAGIFLTYQLQPYGNLADAPIPVAPADTSGTRWVLDCPLSDEPGPAGVYWAEPFTKATCDEFALDFAQRRGVDISGDRFDIIYYDNTTYYSDHSTFCIIVDHNDRSYRYSDYRVEDRHDGWGTATEADLRAALDELGVPLPAAARFYDEGKGRYTFRAANLEQDGLFYDGSIECRVSKSGRLYEVDSAMAATMSTIPLPPLRGPLRPHQRLRLRLRGHHPGGGPCHRLRPGIPHRQQGLPPARVLLQPLQRAGRRAAGRKPLARVRPRPGIVKRPVPKAGTGRFLTSPPTPG